MSPAKVIENLCACRHVGANYLLNVGPTATGAIPVYEGAVLRRVGDWVRLHERAIYEAKPCSVEAANRDFTLRDGSKLYYFAHDLAAQGISHVTTGGGGVGPRPLRGLDLPIRDAHWIDSGEELNFAANPENGLAVLNCTGYPYGSNLVVRVAELTLDD